MNKHVETLRELRADHADGAPYAAALDAAISALSAQTEAVVEAERERCAAVCEALSAAAGRIRVAAGSLESDTGYDCADAIRAVSA
jgi:hypothetical protein